MKFFAEGTCTLPPKLRIYPLTASEKTGSLFLK
jgi:hypothetical protein